MYISEIVPTNCEYIYHYYSNSLYINITNHEVGFALLNNINNAVAFPYLNGVYRIHEHNLTQVQRQNTTRNTGIHLLNMESKIETFAVVFILVFAPIPCMLCYHTFKDKIPNGNNVKNPYDTDGSKPIWRGVGHWSLEGGGPRNPFGLAFKANNLVRASIHISSYSVFF